MIAHLIKILFLLIFKLIRTLVIQHRQTLFEAFLQIFISLVELLFGAAVDFYGRRKVLIEQKATLRIELLCLVKVSFKLVLNRAINLNFYLVSAAFIHVHFQNLLSVVPSPVIYFRFTVSRLCSETPNLTAV